MSPLQHTKIVLPQTRTEAIASLLRAEILAGERAPGSRLNLDELAETFQVSRMPVRDALKQLETEGLVRIFAHRGVEVATLNAEEIEELFGIRIVLEQKAAELAIPRLTKAAFEDMHAMLKRMDKLNGRDQEWIKQNARFHETINRASDWPKLLSLIQTYRDNVQRYIRVYVGRLGVSVSQAQHWALYDACLKRDILTAKTVIHEHLSTTARELVAALPAPSEEPRRRKA